ncbi:MAG: RHS repeat-associated core domain-containing protein [Bacteroidales bacterium]|nr:RHS repeat-associated core domain-containing protein [Bacteroidales bacterium]
MKDTNELKELTPEDTISYTYDNDSDRLLSYDNEQFVYDGIGNPITYRGKTAAWKFGRELVAYDGNTFAYDARGRRISKNDISFEYDHTGKLIKQSNGLEFIYDHTGVFAFIFDASTFFYRKNAQNDIIAILDSMGRVVVEYTYNAWGECITTVVDSTCGAVANLNPFRYRSYYFDTETNLYFLKTRYYDPVVGRFITIDDTSYLAPDTINGLNLYAYCGNNPVMYYDPTGCWTFSINLGIFAGIFGGGYSGTLSFVCDSDEMLGLQLTYSVPNNETTRNTVFGATIGAGVSFQYTNLSKLEELEEKGKTAGINTPAASVDAVMTNNNELVGISAGVGPTMGGDVHINETHTTTLVKFPSLIKVVKKWLGFE